MQCYAPKRIPNIQFLQSCNAVTRTFANGGQFLGDNQLLKHVLYSNVPSYLYVPCRKCPACIRMRATEWAGRLSREINDHLTAGKHCVFVTLTYDNEYVKSAHSTWKKDVAIFFDRLRSLFRRTIRHFVISELGERKGRFHIHSILFDVDEKFAPKTHLWRDSQSRLHGSNPMLVERWQKGIVDTTMIETVGAGVYVSGYLTKNKPTKDGQFYVSPIISSNGIGYSSITDRELSFIKTCLDSNIIPYYEVGGRKYGYPQACLRKYLSPHYLIQLSILSSSRDFYNGGQFKLGTQYFNSYHVYKERLNIYTSSLNSYYTNTDLLYGQTENEFRSFTMQNKGYLLSHRDESVCAKTSNSVVKEITPQEIATNMMAKYYLIMSNYTPF